MDRNDGEEPERGLRPQVVEDDDGPMVREPSKLIRIASMTRALLEEVRAAPLDDAGRRRLASAYETSLDLLHDTLSPDLQEELSTIFQAPQSEMATESELRIVQAQLVGWLEGLFSGIQASLFTQQALAASQLEEMRNRPGLERGDTSAGQYI